VHRARQRDRRRGPAGQARARRGDGARGVGRRMSRARSPLARGLGIVAIVAGALALSPVAAETVKVGVVASYSGPGAEVGRDLDRGMALYRKLHPEAFGGHTVELVKRDSSLPNGEAATTTGQQVGTRARVLVRAGLSYLHGPHERG